MGVRNYVLKYHPVVLLCSLSTRVILGLSCGALPPPRKCCLTPAAAGQGLAPTFEAPFLASVLPQPLLGCPWALGGSLSPSPWA